MPQDQWGLVGAGGEENNSEHEQQVVVHLGRHVKVGHMITCHVMRSSRVQPASNTLSADRKGYKVGSPGSPEYSL